MPIYWVEVELYPKWIPISLWNPSLLTTGVYSIHDDIVSCDLSKIKLSDVPGVSSKWIREYSLSPDTDFKYNYSNNSVLI
jgi:hypothetical protein